MRDAEHFADSYQSGRAPWDVGKPDFNLIHIVTTRSIAPCKALEMGCGTGDNAIWLAQQGFEVLGVDAVPIAIERARQKAEHAGVKCTFHVQDVLETQVEGAPFQFVFDRGFLHLIDSLETRQRVAEDISCYLGDDGLWLSLIGSADEVPGRPGPPQRSARDIVNAVEPRFEILSLASSHFETTLPDPPRAWVCLMKKRPQAL